MLHFTPIYYPVSSELQDVELRNISYLLKNDRFASNQGILETSLRGEHQEIRLRAGFFHRRDFIGVICCRTVRCEKSRTFNIHLQVVNGLVS